MHKYLCGLAASFVFALCLGMSVVWAEQAMADAAVLGDNVAFTMDGDIRSAFVYANDGDVSPNTSPGALNWAESRARLRPTLWVNEIASFAATLDLLPEYRFGDTLALPVVRRAALRLISPVGRFALGRQARRFGLGLRWRVGEDDETLYGFLHEDPVEDRASWFVARRVAGIPLYGELSVGIVQESQTLANATYGVDDRINYTLEAGLEENRVRAAAALFSYEAQGASSTFVYDLSLFGKWVAGHKVRLAFEGGFRRGETREWLLYSPLARGSAQAKVKVEAYRGRFEALLEDVASGDVRFKGSGLVLQAANGGSGADPLGRGWDNAALSAEGVCDCLLAIPVAAKALRDAWLARSLAAIPAAQVAARASAVRNASRQIGLDGFWSAQLHGALQYKGLLARFSGGFFRSLRSIETRQKTGEGSTGAVWDDSYRRDLNLGFELDTTVRYRFAESIDLGLDAGVLFGGALMDQAAGSSDPVVLLMPRLTVSF